MPLHHPIANTLAQAPSFILGALWLSCAKCHRLWRSRRRPASPPPLLVVGSLRSGGTCKTDLVAWIAHRHPTLAILVHPTGDEDIFLQQLFPGRVFVHRDFLAAWESAQRAGFAAALCDGGLQDPALDDCPALCVDLPDAPIGVRDLLPVGRFRELSPTPRTTLHRLLVDGDLNPTLAPPSLPAPGTEVVAATSIARPQAFFANLERQGLVVVNALAFGDHARFSRRAVERTIARHPGTPWLVTTKDAARGELAHLPPGSIVVERKLHPTTEVERIVDGIAEQLVRRA